MFFHINTLGEALLRRARARDNSRTNAERLNPTPPGGFEGAPLLHSQGQMSPLRRVQHPEYFAGQAPSSPMGMALRKKKYSRGQMGSGGGKLKLQIDGVGEEDDVDMFDEGGSRANRISPKFRGALQLDD